MKRFGSCFVFIATALVIMIVFAPRPWRSDAVANPGGGRNLRVGQVLAPAFDASDVREQDLGKFIRVPALPLLLACVISVAITTLPRRLFTLTESPPSRRLSPVDPRGTRAPPSILL
ncbi:MAG: hypothetical protein QOH48_1728 [Actinomycetota bacterium]|nr:hypothetical protein [Actinomycetota bacterium]